MYSILYFYSYFTLVIFLFTVCFLARTTLFVLVNVRTLVLKRDILSYSLTCFHSNIVTWPQMQEIAVLVWKSINLLTFTGRMIERNLITNIEYVNMGDTRIVKIRLPLILRGFQPNVNPICQSEICGDFPFLIKVVPCLQGAHSGRRHVADIT